MTSLTSFCLLQASQIGPSCLWAARIGRLKMGAVDPDCYLGLEKLLSPSQSAKDCLH